MIVAAYCESPTHAAQIVVHFKIVLKHDSYHINRYTYTHFRTSVKLRVTTDTAVGARYLTEQVGELAVAVASSEPWRPGLWPGR